MGNPQYGTKSSFWREIHVQVTAGVILLAITSVFALLFNHHGGASGTGSPTKSANAVAPGGSASPTASSSSPTPSPTPSPPPSSSSQVDHSTSATSRADAFALCRQALPGRDVVSGTWTTVGDLRSYGYSGPVARHPLAGAFPSAAPSDQAAWCWTKDAPDSYTAWGARTPGDVRRALTVNGPTDTTPSGPPIVP